MSEYSAVCVLCSSVHQHLTAEKQGRLLETITLDCSAGNAGTNGCLSDLFDLSMLRFQQRDSVAETFRKYSRKVGHLRGCQGKAADKDSCLLL